MLVDDIGDVTTTNDGATILKLLEIEHPAAKARFLHHYPSGADSLQIVLQQQPCTCCWCTKAPAVTEWSRKMLQSGAILEQSD